MYRYGLEMHWLQAWMCMYSKCISRCILAVFMGENNQIHTDMNSSEECIIVHICMYLNVRWLNVPNIHTYIHMIQHRYIQIWTPQRSGYLHVSACMRVEYAQHTYTYAHDSMMIQVLGACDTYTYKRIQDNIVTCKWHMHVSYRICTLLYLVYMLMHICVYLFQIHTRYIRSYPCCICMYCWQIIGYAHAGSLMLGLQVPSTKVRPAMQNTAVLWHLCHV